MRIFLLIVYFFMILCIVGFAALNADTASLNLYFTILTMPISLLMVICCLLGMVIGFFLFVGKYWRLKSECYKVKNQLKLTEKEIKNLRAIPLQDQH